MYACMHACMRLLDKPPEPYTAPYTLQPTPYTAPYTLHPTPCTLHAAHYYRTVHPTPNIEHHKQEYLCASWAAWATRRWLVRSCILYLIDLCVCVCVCMRVCVCMCVCVCVCVYVCVWCILYLMDLWFRVAEFALRLADLNCSTANLNPKPQPCGFPLPNSRY